MMDVCADGIVHIDICIMGSNECVDHEARTDSDFTQDWKKSVLLDTSPMW